MRHKVSKKKKRLKDTIDSVEFDLDLTEVTPRLIAMGFPSTGLEATYRNSAAELRDYIDRKHGGLTNDVKLYNLCAEQSYPAEASEGKFSRFPFRDHEPPPLGMFAFFCSDVDDFVQKDSNNVAMAHCKAGKGRTGVMLAAYLVWSGRCATAEAALAFYAAKRTNNRKGVTIPSQRRFVDYFCRLRSSDEGDGSVMSETKTSESTVLPREPTDPRPPRLYSDESLGDSEAFLDDSWNTQNRKLLRGGRGGLPPKKWLSVSEIRVDRCPRDVRTVRIRSGAATFEASLVRDGAAAVARFARCRVADEVEVVFYKRASSFSCASKRKRAFSCWLHTRFVEGGVLRLAKCDLDKACKDKYAHPDLGVAIKFRALPKPKSR